MKTVEGSFPERVADNVRQQYERKRPFMSFHEAYAVILEEMDEFKDEVWKKPRNREPANLVEELVDIAAACQKAAQDLELTEVPLAKTSAETRIRELEAELASLLYQLRAESKEGLPRQKGQEPPKFYEVKEDVLRRYERVLSRDDTGDGGGNEG